LREDALRHALIEHSYDLIVVLDDAMHVVWANARVTEVMGYGEDAIGRDALEFIHPDDRDVGTANLLAAMAGDHPADPTLLRLRHADGSWRWADVVGGDIGAEPDIAPARFALYLREVTHREEIERARLDERALADDALRRSEERFRALVLHATDSILVVRGDGTIEQVNPDRGLFGPRPPENVLGHNAFEWVHPDDVVMLQRDLAALIGRPGATETRTCRVKDRNGDWRWIEATATNMLDVEAVQGLVVNHHDITDRVRAEQAAARLLEVIEITGDFVGICDPTGQLLHLNRSARQFAGSDDDLDTLPPLLSWLPDDERRRILELVLPTLDDEGHWSGELRLCQPGGGELPMLARMLSHRNLHGEIDFYSWILRDYSDRKAIEEHLAHQANHDVLTGLPNRALLLDRLNGALARAGRTGEQVAVLFVDLDDFKVVNDRRGHRLGDRVLQELAGRLADAVRVEDSVARYGGDEFVIILERVNGASEALDLAGRIQATLSEPLVADDADGVSIGASIGIALSSQLGELPMSPEALLHLADSAMYRAKHDGRGLVAVADG